MILKLIPVSSFDIEGMELWLNRLADRGLILKKIILNNLAVFERGKAGIVKYSLEPKRDFEESERNGRISFYESFGWDYVCTYASLFFILKADKNSEELYTDKAEQSKIYNTARKSAFRGMITSIAVMVCIYCIGIAMCDFTPYSLAVQKSDLLIMILMVIEPFTVIVALCDYVSVRKHQKRLETVALVSERARVWTKYTGT